MIPLAPFFPTRRPLPLAWAAQCWEMLLLSRIWVASCVAALCGFCALFLRLDEVLLPSLYLAFFATLCLYNLDDCFDCAQQPRASGRAGCAAHGWGAACAGLCVVGQLYQAGWLARSVIGGGLALCTLYGAPLLRASLRPKRVGGLKAPFVGIAVALGVVLVPLCLAGATRYWFQEVATFLLLFTCLALLCTANALLSDVPDAAEDARRGIFSVAVRRGPRVARRRSRQLCGLCLLLILAWATVSFPSVPQLLSLCALFCAALALTAQAPHVSFASSRHQLALGVDAVLVIPLLLQGFFALLTSAGVWSLSGP